MKLWARVKFPRLFADLSHYQRVSRASLEAYSKMHAIVVLAATEGLTYVDPTFAVRWAWAGALGLIRGAYHFARPQPGRSPVAEAIAFWRVVHAAGGRRAWRDLPFILDLEWTALSPRATLLWASAFCLTIRRLSGRGCIGYLPRWFWGGLPAPAQCGVGWPSGYPNPVPPLCHEGHVFAGQFTDQGRSVVSPDKCDLSRVQLNAAAVRFLCR